MPAHPYFPSLNENTSGAVNSVNGEQGDVVLTAQDLQAQPHSDTLTDIAAITMPDNSLLMVNNLGDFTPASCMPAGVAWLGYSTVDQQKAHLSYSQVADSGSYNDLSDKPSIPDAQVASDWNSSGGVSQVLNKPNLSSVALSGSYTDLTNKPTIPSVNYPVTSVNSKTGAVVISASDVGAIATGSSIPYSTLTGTPTIPSAQVNSDWNSTSGVSQILNKPTLFSGNYSDLTGKPSLFSGSYADLTNKPVLFDGTYANLTGKPTTFTPSAHNQSWSTITSTPTTLAGYGITDAYPLSANPAGYLTSTSVTGLRKTETFLGTTDASGNFTITFANTYSTPPDVQPQIIGGTFNQTVRVVSVTNTGCVVQAAQRNLVTLLSIEVLLGATVNLVGASVTVQVTSRT
jgi:hypothetical protein